MRIYIYDTNIKSVVVSWSHDIRSRELKDNIGIRKKTGQLELQIAKYTTAYLLDFVQCKVMFTIYLALNKCNKMIRVCIILAAVTLSTAKPFKCPGWVLYYFVMK